MLNCCNIRGFFLNVAIHSFGVSVAEKLGLKYKFNREGGQNGYERLLSFLEGNLLGRRRDCPLREARI
jgi:hypothetical protein